MWGRIVFYFLFFFIFISAVLWKKQQIISRRNLPVISIANEWSKHGVPIETSKVDLGPILKTTVLTAKINEAGIASSYVSWAVQGQLSLNQDLLIPATGKNLRGKIVRVSSLPHPTTGLYLVESKVIDPHVFRPGDTIRIFASIPLIKQALRLPASVVYKAEDHFYVWKVVDEKVEKQKVKLGATSNQYFQIIEGLAREELVAKSGANQLEQGRPIRIIGGYSD